MKTMNVIKSMMLVVMMSVSGVVMANNSSDKHHDVYNNRGHQTTTMQCTCTNTHATQGIVSQGRGHNNAWQQTQTCRVRGCKHKKNDKRCGYNTTSNCRLHGNKTYQQCHCRQCDWEHQMHRR